MKVLVAKIAQQEFNDAKEFYEIEQAGLGGKFKREIKNAIVNIKRFPYKILYSVQKDSIVLLAFAHQHREPGYWIDRNK